MKGYLLFLIVFSVSAHANFARISRGGFSLPASDLIYQGREIAPEKARSLKRQGVDLADLNPSVTDRGIWINQLGETLDERLDEREITSGETASFQGVLRSAPGEFRFSVTTKKRELVTIYADKKLHTTLLRKNFLRKLGYIVPAIKYLKSIKVTFKNEAEKENFITQMRREAEGTTKRWIDDEKSSELTLYLRDIAAVSVSDTDLYNPAFGVPGGALNSRKLRSLIIPYTLLDLKESVNKFSWNVGRQENADRVILPHFFTNNNFATTTFDDAIWMLRRIAKLTREDFEEAVDKSFFPDPVARLVVEKLISRRNALLNLFNVSAIEVPFETTVSEMPHLLNGKILKQQWRDYGYASEFAAGDATSPFKDFNYYIYSMLQSIGIDSIVSRANEELALFDPNDARIDLAEEEFNRGLEHFVRTGEFLQFPVSNWVSPVVNGNLILSRDVVVGNYLGTENLVQLADTFGYALSLGAIMGVENVDVLDQVSLSATATYLKTFTHVKPLTSLKDVFKEEYRNLAVFLLKNDLKRHLNEAIAANNEHESHESSEDYNQFLSNVVDNINTTLGVGESLIITEKILPQFSAGAKIPLTETGFIVGVSGGVDYIGVKRLQILRRDESTIQIYDDSGHGFGADFTISLEHKIPLMRFEYRVVKGEYTVNSFLVNIDADAEDNPHFLQGVEGLHSLLTTNSSEMLQELADEGTGPASSSLHADYHDRYSRFAFLFWRSQRNRGYSLYDVSTTVGLSGQYITHHDFKRTGMNWESFTKDLIKYGLTKISGGEDIIWRNDVWARPNETFYGSAKVVEANYEGQLRDGILHNEYMSFARRFEGWSKSRAKLLGVVKELNEDFGVKLFTDSQVDDITKLYMYDIVGKLHIYERGIRELKKVSRNDLIVIASHFDGKKRCQYNRREFYQWENENGRQEDVVTCGSLKLAIRKINYCDSKETQKKQTECWLKVVRNMFEDIPFSYLKTMIGKNNYFLEGSVNGFRQNSEILNDPIVSNGFGRRHPIYPYGMIRKVQQRVGIQNGEFTGQWLRERL